MAMIPQNKDRDQSGCDWFYSCPYQKNTSIYYVLDTTDFLNSTITNYPNGAINVMFWHKNVDS